jgi:8-oxo-dGTP pyrophosphatase MutT (NUDIX family)
MSRLALLAELDVYEPSDARERSMVDDVRTFVRTHADCFARTLAVGHVTASAWLLDESFTAVLLTHHRKLGRWLQLGGHADGDDDVRRVARREAQEESGLLEIRFADERIYDIDVHAIPSRPGEPAHTHYDVRFAFVADRYAPVVVSDESHELAWVPLDDLESFGVDASVQRLARKTRALRSSR